jgi:hypothetical protein
MQNLHTKLHENTKFFLAFFRAFACLVKPLFMFNRGHFVLS